MRRLSFCIPALVLVAGLVLTLVSMVSAQGMPPAHPCLRAELLPEETNRYRVFVQIPGNQPEAEYRLDVIVRPGEYASYGLGRLAPLAEASKDFSLPLDGRDHQVSLVREGQADLIEVCSSTITTGTLPIVTSTPAPVAQAEIFPPYPTHDFSQAVIGLGLRQAGTAQLRLKITVWDSVLRGVLVGEGQLQVSGGPGTTGYHHVKGMEQLGRNFVAGDIVNYEIVETTDGVARGYPIYHNVVMGLTPDTMVCVGGGLLTTWRVADGGTFRWRITDPTLIQKVLSGEVQQQHLHPNARIRPGSNACRDNERPIVSPPMGNDWYLDPNEGELTQLSAETYDATPFYVDAHLAEYLSLGRYAPWAAQLIDVEDQRNQVPPIPIETLVPTPTPTIKPEPSATPDESRKLYLPLIIR